MARDPSIEKLTLELRRGVIVVAVLSQLEDAQYGYSLQQRLAEAGMDIEQGTLYPLLRRLHEQGFLSEEWRLEDARPRKYYRMTAAGRGALRVLSEQWRDMTGVLGKLLDGSTARTK